MGKSEHVVRAEVVGNFAGSCTGQVGGNLKGVAGRGGEPGQALFKILLGFLTSGKLGTLAVFFFPYKLCLSLFQTKDWEFFLKLLFF